MGRSNLVRSGRDLESEIVVGKLYNTPNTVMERTRLFPSYSVERLAAALKPGVALEKSALREAGAASASAAETQESPSLKWQKLESDLGKRNGSTNAKEATDETEQLSLTRHGGKHRERSA